MKYDDSEADSGDVVDQRGQSGGGSGPDLGSVLGGMLGGGTGGMGGGGIQIPMGGGGGRKGGKIAMLLMLIVTTFILPKLLSGTAFKLPNLPAPQSGSVAQGNASDASVTSRSDDELAKFANVIITDTNNVWADLFKQADKDYTRTKMVLFTGHTQSGCGPASSDMGPFYCPADGLVYIDLGFFQELATRFGAAGDLAQAYVIAHEVGHHVQDELGISDQVHQQEQDDPSLAKGEDSLSVRLELQADCLAGVWANSRQERGLTDAGKALEAGDLEEALDAASGVGDDAIQKSVTGRVNPEGFTHGTSTQRKRWFKIGFDAGQSEQCDTFSASSL